MIDPAQRGPLWSLRNAAVPLLLGLPGDAKPVTFIEDTAVAPARLPEYVARFRDLLRRHGTDGAFYGHASVGCMHIRPVLNLKSPDDPQLATFISVYGDGHTAPEAAIASCAGGKVYYASPDTP